MPCSNCGLRSCQDKKEVTSMKYKPQTDETARFLKQWLWASLHFSIWVRSLVKCVHICSVTMFLLVFFRGVTEEGRCTQDGHHSRVLRGEKCSHHRGHRLYGESTSGEAAALLSRCQSCLCACPAQSRTGTRCPYRWHDQLQGE